MTLHPDEFIPRFLSTCCPKTSTHPHYGLFASGNRAANIARARHLLGAAPPVVSIKSRRPLPPIAARAVMPLPRGGGQMIVIEVFARGCEPTYRPTPIRIDTS